jgi:transcriptional regulator with XRE-family HTH domain
VTQEELAARADVSARFVSLLETARRQPSLTALHALSTGLGIRIRDLAAEMEKHYADTAAMNSDEVEDQ